MHRLSLVVASRGYSVALCRLLIAVASFVASPGCGHVNLSSCSTLGTMLDIDGKGQRTSLLNRCGGWVSCRMVMPLWVMVSQEGGTGFVGQSC